jgi:NADH dehydrogenase (ubiquinone) flavoprotein 2
MITQGLKTFMNGVVKRASQTSVVSAKSSRAFSDIYVNHRETAENNDSTPFDFTEENYEQVEYLLSKYPSNYKKSAVIPLLFLAQKQNDNFLTIAAMRKVADIIEVSEMEVFEVAAFYTMFNRERLGKYHIQFCGTTPCMLRGIREVIKASEDHLGCKLNETTDDGMFTLVEVF